MDGTGPLGIEPVEDQKYAARTIRCGPFFLPGRDSFPLQKPVRSDHPFPSGLPLWILVSSPLPPQIPGPLIPGFWTTSRGVWGELMKLVIN